MKKVVVIGSGGAGKSTFSQQLGKLLNLPVYHLDSLFWKPNWIPTPNDDWDSIVYELVKKDEWIIDGNYSRTLDSRLEEADLIVFLDMPRYLAMYRIIKRRIIYHGKVRPDMTEGCQEKLDWEFIMWVWNFKKNNRPNILNKLKSYENIRKIIILKSPIDVERFLRSKEVS